MLSDSSESYYFSSEPYSDTEPSPLSFRKKSFHNSPKAPIQNNANNNNSKPIIKRRPIPGLSKAKISANVSHKQVPIAKIANPLFMKKKVLLPIVQDSSSYYEYEYESDNEDLPVSHVTSQPKQLNKNDIKKSNEQIVKEVNNKKNIQCHNFAPLTPPKTSHPTQQVSYPIITHYDDDKPSQDDDKLDENSSSWIDVFECKPDFIDTDEEPDFKLNKPTSNLKKLIFDCQQAQESNENVDSTNIPDFYPKPDAYKDEKLHFKVICTKSQIKNFSFQFYCNDQCLMTAFSPNIRKQVNFYVPELSVQKNIVIGTMSISKHKRQFNLDCFGEEVMSINVSTVKEPFLYDGYFNISLKNLNADGNNLELKTLLPEPKTNRKFTKNSIAKIVLIDSDDQELIVIKRVKENQLEIEASSFINDDLKIFSIGVASFSYLY